MITRRLLPGLALVLLIVAAGFIVRHELGVRAAEREWTEFVPDKVKNLGVVSSLSILPLVNWHADRDDVRTEMGVAYLVETDRHTVLFDLGQNAKQESPSPLEHNMRRLGVRIEDIDAIFVSHAHFDHVGGRRWARQDSFSFGNEQRPLPGVQVFAPAPMKYPGLEPRLTDTPQKLLPGFATTGTIPRQLFMGRIDEQALVVHLAGRGLVVIVGCGHQTLERLLQRVEAAFDEKIYAVVGDLHYPVPSGRLEILGLNAQRFFASGHAPWAPLENDDVERDIELLQRRRPGLVALGGHDTSDEVITRFAVVFGDRAQAVRVGRRIDVR